MKMINIMSLLIVLTVLSCNNQKVIHDQKELVKSYGSVKLEPREVVLSSTYPATLKGKEEVEIKPRVGGFIEELYVDEGAVVRKGQRLFKINSPSSRKTLDDAKAKYNTAQIDVERMQALVEKEIISSVQLKSYQNKLESAKAELKQAEESMTWVMVTSPVDGVVGTISYRLGSLVSNQNVLTKVASTTTMYANFSMNEKQLYDFLGKWKGTTKLEKIANMPKVDFVLSNGNKYQESGKIQTISGVVDQNSGAVNFRASISNKSDLLISGSSGKIIIPEVFKNVLVIPQNATFKIQDKTLVYVVNNNKATQKLINVKGTDDGKNYIVLSGLNSGDVVVTEDVINLNNGQEIKAILN
jgi:membrane fusion protein (multidrug efflux system)